MKYAVRTGEHEFEVELVERDGMTFARHPDLPGGEQPVSLTAVRSTGSYSLRIGDRSLPVVAAEAASDGGGGAYSVTVASETWGLGVLDERELMAAEVSGAGKGGSGGGVMRSVMPGIVRAVHVEAGQVVERGAPLLILEAMKMENELTAETGGTVSVVHVTPGTSVAKGEPLVTLE